ncbi:hypothetical protein GCM10023318_13110 [Nocardia callitridis]|uniref:Uncharacterized protein n=1 Tax=Nocardia callitridis TaxID=648753 RepID=A0ABP9K0F6_9NOCA
MRRGTAQCGRGGEPLGDQIELRRGGEDDFGLYGYVANHYSTPSSGSSWAEPREFPLQVIGRDTSAFGSISSPNFLTVSPQPQQHSPRLGKG